MLPTNILLVLLSVGAIAAPAANSTESVQETLTGLHASTRLQDIVDKLPPPPPGMTEEEKAALPVTRCTYDVSYKMLTFFLFGDNWNVSKATVKAACERHRTMNHWSYNEWTDSAGNHFCAKVNFPLSCGAHCFCSSPSLSFSLLDHYWPEWRLTISFQFNLPMKSTEKLEDRLDKVIARPGWDPEINCEFTKGKNWLNERGHC